MSALDCVVGWSDALDADLEAITLLRFDVMVSPNDQAPFKNVISCSSELTKTRYSISFLRCADGHFDDSRSAKKQKQVNTKRDRHHVSDEIEVTAF